MSSTTDQGLHDVLAALVTLCAVGYLLFLLLRWLGRGRADLSIGAPIAVAVGIRVMTAVGISATGFGSTLRGGDETLFVFQAHEIAGTAFLSPIWTDALTGELFKFVFAAQYEFLHSPDIALRIMQAGIAVAGLALLSAAVWELAGARAALVVAWVLAFEPTNVFFSTLLHKEPNMMLAGGLVAYGGATMWKRGNLVSLWPIVLGCLIAVATRPYAGWFLIAAGAAIALHAGIRARGKASRSLTLVAIVVLFAAISAPTVWEASTQKNLETNVQASQDANASDNSNLRLEQVDFSTREAIIVNLPQRIRDVLLRPYLWQLQNTSQQLGLLGTLFAIVCFFLLIRELWRNRGRIMDRAGPLVYTGFFLLIAYALSAGNAGTGFRYRTHVVMLAVCVLVALRYASAREAAPEPVAEKPAPLREPEPVRA